MSLGSILRQRRQELGLTQDQVSDAIGISKPYLSNIETGRAENPPTDGILRSLEKVLKFQTGELVAFADRKRAPLSIQKDQEELEAEIQKLRRIIQRWQSGRKPPSGLRLEPPKKGNVHTLTAGVLVPVINKVKAGYPGHFTDLDYPSGVADEYVRCPELHDAQAFGAYVSGDSMEPEYHDGDVVVFSPNLAVHDGNDCFVRFAEDGGTTFKRFYQEAENVIRLQPLNSKYRAEVYPREKITGLWPAAYRIQKLRTD